MVHAISLIYGEQVLEDVEFCSHHNLSIERYAKGIMTLTGAPLKTLESVARDPASIPGWTHLLEMHPEDYAVLQDFLGRLICHYLATGQRPRTGE